MHNNTTIVYYHSKICFQVDFNFREPEGKTPTFKDYNFQKTILPNI